MTQSRKIVEITDKIIKTSDQIKSVSAEVMRTDYTFVEQIDDLLTDFYKHDTRRSTDEPVPEAVQRLRSSERNMAIQETVDQMKTIMTQVQSELTVAREIQQKLLPDNPITSEAYEISGRNLPSQFVGGDYFDYFPISDSKVFFSIGDVSGKGVSASLLMTFLKAYLKAKVETQLSLPEIIQDTNTYLFENSPLGKFITFFGAVLDTEAGHIEYVNAGHNPPILLQPDGPHQLLQTGGTVLGAFPGMIYESEIIPLETVDLLVMYTDGVTEAEDASEDMYGEDRLIDLLKQINSEPVDAIIEAVFQAVYSFSPTARKSDDITLVMFRHQPGT